MANTEINIYPFGTNGVLPAGYPIADDLVTNSAQKALSAKQGVRLKEMIQGVSSDMVINCLGDSITEGWMGSATSNNKWTTQMADILGCHVNNYGDSGTGICYHQSYQPFVTRLNNMVEANIDLLLIFGGYNDCVSNFATSIGTINDSPALGGNFYASFKHLIEAAITKYPSAVIAVITPLRSKKNTALNGNTNGVTLEQIVNAEVEVCKYYGIPCYDYFHTGGLSRLTTQLSLYLGDDVHPNQAGIDKWLAPQFTKFAADLLANKQPNNATQ